jgi:arsenate reductase (thioredoxin)
VPFLCTHNAGRSQVALGFFTALAGETAVGWSGGSEPANEINTAAIAAMAEVGIDISAEYPRPWTDETVRAADVVISMGCGDACPIFPGKRYESWDDLNDPPASTSTTSDPSATRSRPEFSTSSPSSRCLNPLTDHDGPTSTPQLGLRSANPTLSEVKALLRARDAIGRSTGESGAFHDDGR